MIRLLKKFAEPISKKLLQFFRGRSEFFLYFRSSVDHSPDIFKIVACIVITETSIGKGFQLSRDEMRRIKMTDYGAKWEGRFGDIERA